MQTIRPTFAKHNARGFTLLELLIVIAIIAIALGFSGLADNGWQGRKGLENSYHLISNMLSRARNEALLKSSTTRVDVSNVAGLVTVTSYISSTPVDTCDGTGTWATLEVQQFELGAGFQLTGSGLNNTCFYRDGTASGGDFILSQLNGGTDIGRADIVVVMATGALDIEVE